MSVAAAIAARRTARDFAPRPIPGPALKRFLKAGWNAPAGGGRRPWHFVIVEDPAIRRLLADGFRARRTPQEVAALVDSWAVEDPEERAMYLDALPRQASMVEAAGALVIPCFDQPEPVLGAKASLHELNGLAAMWMCVENILVAAAAEGICGVTKVPSTPAETANIRRVLGIPENIEIPCYLALGYPGPEARFEARQPFDEDDRIFTDRWRSAA